MGGPRKHPWTSKPLVVSRKRENAPCIATEGALGIAAWPPKLESEFAICFWQRREQPEDVQGLPRARNKNRLTHPALNPICIWWRVLGPFCHLLSSSSLMLLMVHSVYLPGNTHFEPSAAGRNSSGVALHEQQSLPNLGLYSYHPAPTLHPRETAFMF